MVQVDEGTYMPKDETMLEINNHMREYNDKVYDNLVPIIRDTLMESLLQLVIVKVLNKELMKLPDGLPRTLVVDDKTFVVMYSNKEITINII